ncbi:zinc-binding dehydrogenase [Streptomyces muensis]|uniref:Zinc-binding dehydrogenase n=1 Tax=Streptomyces muensis TaxID=1077944 RepID=A0A9X1PVN0_STRM4|nr:zinc-binding dehydrogenase [Streptomyces muensis]MCF1592578.1 zinc-binding dehydrogenase [Streptomyces muensis]
MKAVVATAADADDPVRCVDVIDLPTPEPGSGQTLVTVAAAALNHHDLWTLRGAGAATAYPHVLGCDVAGTTPDGTPVVVHALVADASRGGGDELLDPRRGTLSDALGGAFAEQVVVPTANLVAKPEQLSFAEAACLPTAWLTAYRMLFERADVRPGDSVLVQGAGGGVATAAVQLGAAAGLRMWVTGRSEAKRAKAAEIGADRTFSTGERLPERVDAVLDTVGEATWAHSVRSVRPGGTVVVAGWTTGAGPAADLSRLSLNNITVRGSAMGRRRDLESVLALCVHHGIRPHIDGIHSFADAPKAFARLERGEVFGKAILRPGL